MRKKLLISDLKAIREGIESVRIYSTEGGIYTVQIIIDGEERTLYQANPSLPLYFRNLLSAKAALKQAGLKKAMLMQYTPYNEMIGLSEAASNALPLEVPISLVDGDVA